jgi:hypothetical protein
MSPALLAAAALAVLLGLAHSYLGERYILMRLFRRGELPRLFGGVEFTRRTLRFAWHITSLAWAGFAALLVALATPAGGPPPVQARIISATFALSGVLALVASRGRHLSWLVFFLIAALAWLGSRA